MKCPKCEHENRAEAKFCDECGAKLELACPECGRINRVGAKYCDECGNDLRKPKATPLINYDQPDSYTPKFLAEKILTTRGSIEGERKLVTVMFADVSGFTPISEKLDPEDVHEIMDGCFRIIMDEIHKFEGTINQFAGDGVMALFGAPVAHEDHAQRACHAALSIQKALVPYSAKLKEDLGIDFKMRIGLNSGPVIVGSIGDDLRMDYTAVGDTTNLAARIQQAAQVGQVWVSRETHGVIRDYFNEERVGALSLKGKARPQLVYRLVSARSDVRTRFDVGLARGVTELVGRGAEMEFLHAAFERSKRGSAHLVDVVGEAGVGKSRLMYEFQGAVADEVTFLTGICLHYGPRFNFLPMIDLVRAAFDIRDGMTEEEIGSQIRKKATGVIGPMTDFYRSLLSLDVEDSVFKSLDPEGLKFGTFEAVKELLLALSSEKPLVVFLEDIQWIDTVSEEFFTYFARSSLDHPILMLSAYRPERAPLWAQGRHYHRLELETLDSESSSRLVRNSLGGLPLDDDCKQRIVERAGGNPFFVEEIVRELVDRGDIVERSGRCVCSSPIDQLEIPTTIQGVLAGRMDRLRDEVKRTMQVAAVIGTDVGFRLLQSVMEMGRELKDHLNKLVELEILYEKAIYPELEYAFRHALTRDVAYDSMLKQKRRDIHGRIARTIEELYSDRLDEQSEVLAHHYEQSGKATKAIEYLILAGEKSNKQYAGQAAGKFFQRGLELAERPGVALGTEQRARLHRGRGRAGLSIGDIGTAEKGFRKSIELCRKNGLIALEMKTLPQLAMIMHMWPEESEADRTLEELIARAEEVGDEIVRVSILLVVAFRTAHFGRSHRGHRMLADAERMAMETGQPELIFYARINRSFTERWLGRPRKALELTEGAIEILRARYSREYLSEIIFNRGVALAEVGRIEDGMSVLKNGIDICEEFGVSNRLGTLYNTLGYCYQEIHQSGQALKFNQRSEEIAGKLMEQYPMGRPQHAEVVAHANINIMENLFDQGRLDEAWNRMQAFRETSNNDDFNMLRNRWESRMNYLAAQILLCRDDLHEAESLIRSCLDKERKGQTRKREGGFLRMLGEVLTRRGRAEDAVANLHEAIVILMEVGNPGQLRPAHAALATALEKLGRTGESREQWGAAAEVIRNTANGLSDRQLRDGFLQARPVREILSRAQG